MRDGAETLINLGNFFRQLKQVSQYTFFILKDKKSEEASTNEKNFSAKLYPQT